MDDLNAYNKSNGLNNEWSLFNSYTESLESALKIEQELTSLRKNSENKINILNNQLTKVNSNNKFLNKENIAESHEHISKTKNNPIFYDIFTDAYTKPNNHEVFDQMKSDYEPKSNGYSPEEDSSKFSEPKIEEQLFDQSLTNNSLCISKYNSQINDDSDVSQLIESQYPIDMENISNFSKKLNNLYAHLIRQYIRDEKLLSKYFEVMYNVREKAALSMAKNELMRIKAKKSQVSEQSSSFKKKQRALLMKLHHEYNEIMFMKNFQKKLSDDRKKILLRQLKHFRTMFSCNIDGKYVDKFNLKRSYNLYKARAETYPIKCYNFPKDSLARQNGYSFLSCHKEKLDNLLHLHMDLQVNAAQLDSLQLKRHSNSDVVNDLKQLSKKLAVDQQQDDLNSIELVDAPIPDTNIQLLTNSESLEHDNELERVADTNKSIKPILDINENSDDAMSLYTLPTFSWNFTANNSIKEIFHIQNDSVRMLELLYNFFMYAGSSNAEFKIQFQNILERLFMLQNALRESNCKTVKFFGSDNVSCIVSSMLELMLCDWSADTRKKCVSKRRTIEAVLNVNLSNLSDEMLMGILKKKYIKINRKSGSRIRLIRPANATITSYSHHNTKSNNVKKCHILEKTDEGSAYLFNNESPPQKTDLKLDVVNTNELLKSTNADFRKGKIDARPELASELKINAALDSTLTQNRTSKGTSNNKSYQNEEAEELRKKQLAVEMEIKALLEQQTTQIPYFVVREIPDKPPPPYIPPSEDKISTGTSTDLFIDEDLIKADQIGEIVKHCFENIWLPYLTKPYTDDVSAMENFKNQCALYQNNSVAVNNLFLFDLCNEMFCSEFKDRNKKLNKWDYEKYSSAKNKKDMCMRVEDLVNHYLKYDTAISKDNIFINCAHKLQDHVDELLIKELQDEEPEWVNVEEYEVNIKKSVTDFIFESLINDTVNEYKMLYEDA